MPVLTSARAWLVSLLLVVCLFACLAWLAFCFLLFPIVISVGSRHRKAIA